MRIIFGNSKLPRAAAKLIVRYTDHVKLHAAQEAVAKATGYRDWHDLDSSIVLNGVNPTIDLEIAKAVILRVSDILGCAQGDIQYAVTKSRLLNLSLEENLRIRTMIWRERVFGPSARGKAGTLVRVQELRGREVGYLKPGEDGYSRVLYDSGFGDCTSSEVITPKVVPEDFAPSILWLPYGYWKVEDGSTIVFSRDYKPLWRIKDGAVDMANPWDWISDIREERWFREMAGSGSWSYGPARELALKFLSENRIFEAPRLLDAMPLLFEAGTRTVGEAVKRLQRNRISEGSLNSGTFVKLENGRDLEEGKSYPFIDFPIEHMVPMQLRLEQQGWRIAERLPDSSLELPPIRHGYARRFGLDWVGRPSSLSHP